MNPNPDRETRVWNEIAARFAALEWLPGAEPRTEELQDGMSLRSVSVPASDPTGLNEILETRRSEHIREWSQARERFPYYVTVGCDAVFRGDNREEYVRAAEAFDRRVKQAAEWLAQQGLEGGAHYCTTGFEDFIQYHLPSEDVARRFCEALGLGADRITPPHTERPES